ncbi:YeeE/YedE thiosulfate transporter family protein [Thermincola potens]|uniref:Uncharacterized protein n=1 Tax=Thermincola potens (strain JR) TaxID=635013 RepID=D5XB69_THEPJ|nr:YeeE/YedE thiosulfate transporter family protein [Thermincola potens]ADG81389.1 protein of unknown function DUF395 YeeE/YedE [Thermincola potens JR]
MKRFSQPKLALAIGLAILVFGIKLYFVQPKLVYLWLIGIALGFVLYRSGICFAAAYQNLFLFRNYSLARAVILMIIISLAGISLLQAHAHFHGQVIPGRFHSFGLHTVVGGFLFGLGMVLAGGCAAGSLQRIGEGFIIFIPVLIAVMVGSTFGAYHFSWWKRNFITHQPVFLPDVFGWINSILAAIIILTSIYFITLILEKKFFTAKEWQKWRKKS